MISGMKIHVTPDYPKMQLSPDVMVSDAFRAETNAWMRRFFGTTSVLADGEVVNIGGCIYMNQRTLNRLKWEAFQRSIGELA